MYENEVWKEIKNYPQYEVSNCGRVRSLKRKAPHILKACMSSCGYLCVTLSKEGKVKTFPIAKLVAEAFIPNPNNFPQVNHKDEDKSNNRVSNLEWMTLKRNINYGTRNKRMALTKGKNVKAFDDDGNFIMWFCSMAVAEKITGINQGDISRCTLGKTEHAGGYVWKIVKQGGVSDDVCEWRLCDEEANIYDTSCRNPHILIEGTPKENNYEYCPYCGKKIKVVE